MDRTRWQPYRCTVRRQRAVLRINGERGDVMLGPRRAVTRSAAAGRNVKMASRDMRPGILDTSGQPDRATLDQFARDIDVEVRQFGSDICIERDLLRRRLGGRWVGHGGLPARSDKTNSGVIIAPPADIHTAPDVRPVP